jgi:hypothetical protein
MFSSVKESVSAGVGIIEVLRYLMVARIVGADVNFGRILPGSEHEMR